MNPIVSIIVPVFNAEEYLSECLASIKQQTFANFEVVLIDDGSRDKSGEICDSISRHDSRFITIHQENKGSSAARNTGLLSVNGEYVTFIDADDIVASGHIDNMIKTMMTGDYDAAIFAYFKLFHDKNTETKTIYYEENKPRKLEMRTLLIDTLNNSLHSAVWHQMFKTSFIKKKRVQFPDSDYAEDTFFSLCVIKEGASFAYSSTATYYYIVNQSSQAHNTNPNYRVKKFYELANNFSSFFDKYNLWEDKELVKSVMSRINEEKVKLLKIGFSTEIKRAVMNTFPESYKGDYIYIKNISDLLHKYAIKYGSQIPLNILNGYLTTKGFFKQKFHSLISCPASK